MQETDSFEALDRADKKAMREALEKMLARFLKQGGKIQKLGQPTCDELLNRKQKTWSSIGEKKPPTKSWENPEEFAKKPKYKKPRAVRNP